MHGCCNPITVVTRKNDPEAYAEIVDEIINEGIYSCKGEVKESYIKKVLQRGSEDAEFKKEEDTLMISRVKKSAQVCGFLFFRVPKGSKKRAYVSLVCSDHHIGSHLLAKAETLSIKHNLKAITLSAIPTAVSFYMKKGFDVDADTVDMIYTLKSTKRITASSDESFCASRNRRPSRKSRKSGRRRPSAAPRRRPSSKVSRHTRRAEEPVARRTRARTHRS
jgi:hypothetical protein